MRRAGKLSAAFAILLLVSCGGRMSGIVLDATTERPVANAAIALSERGWGMRDGQLVWDAEKLTHTTTDSLGRFAFDADGGVQLRVRSATSPAVETSLCARSPMTVRIGGSFADLRADKRLVLGTGISAPTDTVASEIGLNASALAGDSRMLFEAKGGVRFVEGTGAIPRPPQMPYPGTIELDLATDCGWLFVGDGSKAVAVIQVAGYGWEQDPGGPRRLVLLFTRLPHGKS